METLLAIVLKKDEEGSRQEVYKLMIQHRFDRIHQTREYPDYTVFVLDRDMDYCWGTRYDKPKDSDTLISIWGIKK